MLRTSTYSIFTHHASWYKVLLDCAFSTSYEFVFTYSSARNCCPPVFSRRGFKRCRHPKRMKRKNVLSQPGWNFRSCDILFHMKMLHVSTCYLNIEIKHDTTDIAIYHISSWCIMYLSFLNPVLKICFQTLPKSILSLSNLAVLCAYQSLSSE